MNTITWIHALWLAYQDAVRDRQDDAAHLRAAWLRALAKAEAAS